VLDFFLEFSGPENSWKNILEIISSGSNGKQAAVL